jgi:hypothetical protein
MKHGGLWKHGLNGMKHEAWACKHEGLMSMEHEHGSMETWKHQA